jgi:hypothetical protein
VDDFPHGSPQFCALLSRTPNYRIVRSFKRPTLLVILTKHNYLNNLAIQIETIQHTQPNHADELNDDIELGDLRNSKIEDLIHEFEKGIIEYGKFDSMTSRPD